MQQHRIVVTLLLSDLVDPKLTPKGQGEAQAVSEWSAAHLRAHAEILFVSPM